jgi:hypothetical protein
MFRNELYRRWQFFAGQSSPRRSRARPDRSAAEGRHLSGAAARTSLRWRFRIVRNQGETWHPLADDLLQEIATAIRRTENVS